MLGQFLTKYCYYSTGNLRKIEYEQHFADADLNENKLDATSPTTDPSLHSANISNLL